MCGSMVSIVKSLVWEVVCIRVLSLVQSSSSFSALVCHGNFCMLMTWRSTQTPKVGLFPSSRRGRLAWLRVWKRPSSWSLVLAWCPQQIRHIHFAVCCSGVSNNSTECRSASCEFTISAAASSFDWWVT